MSDPTEIVFHTSGLLSKWGFSDGDLLDDVLYDNGLTADVDDHAVLVAAVERWVLPVIEERVEVTKISTIHNPIRAETVNGVEVDWYDALNDAALRPETVSVPVADIVTLARELVEGGQQA